MKGQVSPATKTGTIFDCLNTHNEKRSKPSEFELARLNRDIESLKNASITDHYLCSAALSCVMGDYDAMVAFSEKAMQVSGNSTQAIDVYLASLSNFGAFADAAKLARRCIPYLDGDKELLESAIESLIEGGYLAEALDATSRYQKQFGEHSAHHRIEGAYAAILKAGVPEPEYQQIFEVIQSMNIEHRSNLFMGTAYEISCFGDSADLTFQTTLDASEISRVQRQLNRELYSIQSVRDLRLSVTVDPLNDDGWHAA